MGEVLYRGKALAIYNQVALIDADDVDAYPQWTTGAENAILGPKGVAVSALGDTLIDIIIYQGDTIVDGILYISGEIFVGKFGLIVGNDLAGTSDKIPWPSGKTYIKVYANGPQNRATQIIFVLELADLS